MVFLVLGPRFRAEAENVSRQVPPIYTEKLEALLTPLKEVLPLASATRDGDRDGVVLLSEEVHYIDESGGRYILIHQVDKALNETGAKAIEEDTFHYRKANQKIHLASASTILPDGRTLPVGPTAAILQSPQRQADYALYDDEGELRVIFPNIKPGAITETIVIIEESQFRIPGEFTANVPFAFGWPVRKVNRMVEMPARLAERLHSTTLGAGVPEADKQTIPENRVRMTWKSENIAALSPERNRPPLRQTGPILWLTTLADWKVFTAWYAPLVEAQTALSPALKRQIDEWTKDASSPERTLEILMAKVAADVRYVGLEFDATDLQPHNCNEVWENQYGDCKDKANLLRAMLRYKGVTAYLALLNTQHVGRIEQRSPDYRQFNHAIVAVERAPGEYTFCDPTIAYARPGLISPSDADRDVLLVQSGDARWAHTPAQEGGTMHYDLDLKADADGGLEGWLTQESTAYYGALDADSYPRLSKEQLLEKGHDIASGFFPEAEVVDVTRTSLEKWDGTYRFKAYLIVRGAKRDQQDALSLTFPQSASLFVNAGTQKQRKTPFYLWRDVTTMSARFKLPDGFAPSSVPRPFHVESPALDGSAAWTFSAGECRATLELRLKQDLVPPAQFETFYNSLFSLRSWLNNPLPLSRSEGKTATPLEKVVVEDFPILSSGEAQLGLVERRYPLGSNNRLRREALQIVMQYFPTDKTTLFNAGLRLALLDWDSNNAQAALDQVLTLLKSYRDSVPAEDFAWGEYLQAMTLNDLRRSVEALKIFERLGRDTQISERRRAWADYQQARILETQSAPAAIQALRAGLAFETDAQPAEFTLLAKLLIAAGRMEELKKEIAQVLEKKPDMYAEMLTRLAGAVATFVPAERAVERGELLRVLEEAGKSGDLGGSFDEALQNSRDRLHSLSASEQVRERLRKRFADSPLPVLESAAGKFKTRADFTQAIGAAEKDQKPDVALRYALEYLTRFDPDSEFPFYLWKATAFAEWKGRAKGSEDSLLPVLFELCDLMPSDSDTYADGRLLQAKLAGRRGDLQGARKMHEELLRNPGLSGGFKVVTHERLARNLESLCDYEGALGVYRQMESELEYATTKDVLLRAVFLDLEMGRREEAWRLLALLGGRRKEALKTAANAAQLTELTALEKNRGEAEKYWAASAKWWPAWLALEQSLDMKSASEELLVPVIPNLQEMGEEIGMAIRTKDRPTLFRDLRMLAHGARWLPSTSNELVTILAFVATAVPEQAGEIRRFGVTLAENFASDQEDLMRRNLLWGAVYSVDLFDNATALRFLRAFAALPPKDDAIAHGVARLWGLEAQRDRAETARAIAVLEKAVASPALKEQRGMTVTLLADLYHQAGRTADEEKVLQREMENPQTKNTPADLQMVTERYKQITQAGEDARKFSTAVERWLQKNRPAWFEYAEPKSLEDPRMANVDDFLKKPAGEFLLPETIKAFLLVAQAPGQPYASRTDAFSKAIARLADLANTTTEALSLYTAVIDDASFEESLRITLLWEALYTARAENNRAEFEKLHAHPLMAKMNERGKASIETYRRSLAVDDSSPDAVRQYCEELLQKEIDFTTADELRRFHQRLLQLGQVDAAEKIRGQLASARIDPSLKAGSTGLQLEYLKAQNQAKRWLKMATALREVVLARFPAETIQAPPALATVHDSRRLRGLPEADAEHIRLYQVKTWNFELSNLLFWEEFIHEIRWIDGDHKLSLELIATALQNAPDDAARALVVSTLAGGVDEDDDEIRRELTTLFQPYRRAEDAPATYAEIRMRELHYAMRRGERVDLEAIVGSLSHPSVLPRVNRLKLTHYIQTKNLSLLRQALDAIGTDDLLTDRLLPLSLRAFALAGMKEELEVATPAARKDMYRHILLAWAVPMSYDVHKACEFAQVLKDPAALPENWLSAIIGHTQNRFDKESFAAHEAFTRKDWPAVVEAADHLLALYPTFYHYDWYKGEALYQMGKKHESIALLQIYVRYSKDELEYPIAAERLKECESAVAASAAGAK